MSEPPVGGGARVGNVGAIGPRADGAVEMLAERGMVLGDPGHRLADRAGHSGSGALRGGRGSSITTTQPERARELLNQEVTLGVSLGGPRGVADGAGLLKVVVDLGQASAVGVLGLGVQDLARVAECRTRQAGAGRLAAF